MLDVLSPEVGFSELDGDRLYRAIAADRNASMMTTINTIATVVPRWVSIQFTAESVVSHDCTTPSTTEVPAADTKLMHIGSLEHALPSETWSVVWYAPASFEHAGDVNWGHGNELLTQAHNTVSANSAVEHAPVPIASEPTVVVSQAADRVARHADKAEVSALEPVAGFGTNVGYVVDGPGVVIGYVRGQTLHATVHATVRTTVRLHFNNGSGSRVPMAAGWGHARRRTHRPPFRGRCRCRCRCRCNPGDDPLFPAPHLFP